MLKNDIQPESTVKISGTIERFIFHNQENGFTVCVIMLDKQQSITASGTLPQVTPGQEVDLLGNWVMHKKFGRQFTISSCIEKVPTTITGLKKYLGSDLLKASAHHMLIN